MKSKNPAIRDRKGAEGEITTTKYRGQNTMTMLSVEKRLARLEAIVLKNGTKLGDSTAKVEYIAACDHPEIFEAWSAGEDYKEDLRELEV